MDLDVAVSERSTLGIEWELLVVDPRTRRLVSAAPELLADLFGEDRSGSGSPERDGATGPGTIVGEFAANTVELVTGVCRTVSQGTGELGALLDRARSAAHTRGLDLTCAGVHPSAAWRDQEFSAGERYQRLLDRAGPWARRLSICGVHVHVGLADPEAHFPVLGALQTRSAVLQALSASSPLWQGRTTGYASHRTMLFQQLPTAEPPYLLPGWDEYASYLDDMFAMGVIEVVNELRWDIRPVAAFGTLEMRVCDGVPSLAEIGSLAALTQCLVDDFAQRFAAGETLPHLAPWQVAENKWRAARYGVDALLVTDRDGTEAPVADIVAHLTRDLAPVADRLGCAAELSALTSLLGDGACYRRLLRAAGVDATTPADTPVEQAGLDAAVDHLLAETAAGRPLPA